jgi:TonB-linked SusC/RagA family outer membrane protein
MKKKLAIFVFGLLLSTTMWAQRAITGSVTDENGQALPGVNVIVKGTTSGTITDAEGIFSIIVSESAKVLQFSFIGYASQEVDIASISNVNVQLQLDAIGLEEVVAVGYGTQKRANLTGAVTTVSTEDIDARALTSTSQILQGKVAGVSITQNSGQPGNDNSTIRIRGISSIDNNNNPLVIIDGIEGSLNDVYPSDIKSISVLKDAASASIYGSRASAGVIIIETKSGVTGLKIDYTGSHTIQRATRLPDIVNSWEHLELNNEAKINMGLPPSYDHERINLHKYGIDPAYPNTNWQDLYYDSAFMQNHYLNARGSGDNYRFSSSVGYLDQSGVLLGTASEKLTFRNKLDVDFLNKKVKVGMSMSGYTQDIDELSESTNSVLAQVAALPPTAWAKSIPDEDDNIMYSYAGRHYAAYEEGGYTSKEGNSLISQYYIQIEPIKDVKGNLKYSKNKHRLDYVRFIPEFMTGDLEGNPARTYESSLQKYWTQTNVNTLQATLNYSKTIADEHKFSALVAYERIERNYKRDDGNAKHLSSNEAIFSYGDPTSFILTSSANESSIVSYFGRLNYAFAGKYLLEFNLRRDGSSRFAAGNKWGNFPSFSAGWRVSEEDFMSSLDFINLKLRGSWGRLGNQNIGTYYAASDQMSGNEYYAFGHEIVSGRGTSVLANPGTTWETTEQINIGFDAYFWDRVTANFEYFYKTTYDILARVTIPPSLGVTVLPYQNIGDMLNTGIELSIGYNSKAKSNAINYSINGNFSFLKNEVTDLGVLEYVDHSSHLRSQVGESFSSFYGYVSEGIYQIGDFTWQNDSDPSLPHQERDYVLKEGLADPSEIMFRPMPGDLKFKDVNTEGEEAGVINPNDKTIIGSSVPKVHYGINLNASYKNFGINVLGQGVAGAESYQAGKLVQPFHNAGQGSVLREHADRRWTFENQSSKYMRLIEDKARDALISSYYVHDASYFRLKSVELSYSLPTPLVKKLGVEKCRFFVSGENLVLITKYLEGFDPEKPYNQVNTGFHPQTVSYTLGVNLNF